MSEGYEEILWGNEYHLLIFLTVVIVSWVYIKCQIVNVHTANVCMVC